MIDVEVTAGSDIGRWSFGWPSGDTEEFYAARWYHVADHGHSYSTLVASVVREAWGREDRRHAVVFGRVGGESIIGLYPWTEFIETDDGDFAAVIPDPARPRALLHDGDLLREQVRDSVVERADRLYHSIAKEPSLRVVVTATDVMPMVRHGLLVARLRQRVD